MEWKVTVLCENTVAAPGLMGEHGFSAFIETPGGNILFDTGQGFGLVQNASRLQKDLRTASALVLSHGHFDHTGGILSLLANRGSCDIVAHPDVFTERFWLLPAPDGEKPVSIGMPWPQAYLTTRGAQFKWTTRFEEILPGVFVTGEVPRRTPFERPAPKFVVRSASGWTPDPFLDDYSLVLKTDKGLVVILGCAHAGTINVLEHAIRETGENRIHAVMGGTHLGFSAQEQLDLTVEALKKYEVKILAVSHCTGLKPIARLASEFGTAFAFGSVGFELSVPC